MITIEKYFEEKINNLLLSCTNKTLYFFKGFSKEQILYLSKHEKCILSYNDIVAEDDKENIDILHIHDVDDNMKKELCIKTIEQLTQQYGNELQNMIFHSDRGSQYTSEAFRSTLKSHGITQSLSGIGHCFDNARMESFWATPKKEKIYHISAYKLTREDVKRIVFRYIFVY